ncbi:hypothetical protein ACW9UM_05050 [Marinovum sp. KMM 9989]
MTGKHKLRKQTHKGEKPRMVRPAILILAMALTLLSLAALPTVAHAGAWSREKGTWFTASAAEFSGYQDINGDTQIKVFNNLYLEYGLTQSLTIGLDVGHTPGTYPDARVFLRLPVLKRGAHILSVEASTGHAGGLVSGLHYSSLGASYGRSFQLAGHDGWLGLDTRIVQGHGPAAEHIKHSKLDLTLGLTHANGLKSMAQVFHTQVGDSPYTTFAPSLVVPVGRKLKIQTGLLVDLHATGPIEHKLGLKLGLWREF